VLLSLYRSLLCLFPARYRFIFGQEMSVVFQQAQADAWGRGAFYGAIFCIREFTDLIPAAFREQGRAVNRWVERTEFCERPTGSRGACDAVPAFYTCESYSPRRSALIHGGLLSLAAFSAVSFAIAHSVDHGMFLIGSHHHSRSNLLEVRSPTVAPTNLDTEVKVKPERGRPNDVWSRVLSLLRSAPVLSQPQHQHASAKEAEGRQRVIGAATSGDKELRPEIKLKPDPGSPAGVWSTLRSLLSALPLSFSTHPALLSEAPAGRPNVAAAGASQAEESEYDEWDDPRGGFPSSYFRVILVLAALDADHDGIISAAEIANSPAALRSLDRNHDGKLSPEECGQGVADSPAESPQVEGKLDLQFQKRARLEFMRFNPVLAALDADHDGESSTSEIQNAAAALKRLDKNGDGKLTQEEVLPGPVANAVSFVMRLDANGDGKISKDERSGELGRRYRELLDAADQNEDGVVTEEELTNEIRHRAVLNGIMIREEMQSAARSGALAPMTPADGCPPKIRK
jgi:Ca2+-binding EF-hand superfamily protein